MPTLLKTPPSNMLSLFSLLALISVVPLSGCDRGVMPPPKTTTAALTAASDQPSSPNSSLAAIAPSQQTLLTQSWTAYRQRFVQADGRVIDWEGGGITTSEGQAYAMLRSVFINDPKTFDLTLKWAESNLQRQTNGKPLDHLWSWKWGQNATGTWGILDQNFASDADIDAVTALILAARRWQRPEYLKLARLKLQDLWTDATFASTPRSPRYLLPGPSAVFRQQATIQINPSYLAPYAFRLFAQVDPTHDWLSLVESSYQVLEKTSTLSTLGLPSDWVALDTNTGQFTPLDKSQYSFDAFRVWWRISLDAAWFKAPQAQRYLKEHLKPLQVLWRSQRKIPARISLQGQPLVTYEATAQYGMLYAALRQVDPLMAEQIYQQKLLPTYRSGFWDHNSAYYTQNLVWFGLLPPGTSSFLLQPAQAAQATTQP